MGISLSLRRGRAGLTAGFMPPSITVQPSGRPHSGQNRRVTMTAPLQVIAFSFSLGADFEGRILEEVDRLQGRGVLRLLDMIFVAKGQDGTEIGRASCRERV